MSDSDSGPDSPPLSPRDHVSSKPTHIPWIEKYRPKKLDDVAHQDEVVNTLRRTLQSGNLPHLLFYGPPGTGKTSTILAMARELYGPELMKKRVLELNASNERGIDVIRHKVKEFAQIAVGSRDSVPGYPCPPFKIIILDEADSMTKDAQSALRRTMEQYTKVTRFCIICNYVSRIIEPITSRCAKFRYKSLDAPSMIQRLDTICQAEGLNVQAPTLNKLVEISEGDMRRSINLLQSAQKLVPKSSSSSSSSSTTTSSSSSSIPELTTDHVIAVAGLIPDERILGLIKATKQGAFRFIQQAATDFIADGFPVDQALVQLSQFVIKDQEISDLEKAKISIRMAENEQKLIQGADEYLQLLDTLSYLSQTIAQPAA